MNTAGRCSAVGVITLLASALCAGQQPDPWADLSPEVRAAIEASRTSLPEFHADALIRLAASGLVREPRAKKLLLEEAFAVARNAQEPVKRESAIAAGDTRASLQSRGFDLDLDVLSLQSRAAAAMLPVDAAASRELMVQIRPSLAPLACSDPLIYEISSFYTEAAALLASPITTPGGATQKDAGFLDSYMADLTSPAQVAGLAELLRRADLPGDELERLALLLAWSLERVSGDSRSFFQATGAPASVTRLLEHLADRGLPVDRLIEAFRRYLVRNLAAERCQTSDVNQRYWMRQVEDFNDNLRVMRTSHIPAITPAETTPPKIGGEAPASQAYWQTAEVKALLNARDVFERNREDREAGRASIRLLDYLELLNNWTGRSEPTEADYFHQKSGLFTRLLRSTSDPHDRQHVLADYLSFLARHDLDRESRMAWAVHLEDVMRVMHGWRTEEQTSGLALMYRLGNLTMKLRSRLESLAQGEPGLETASRRR